MAFRSNEYLQRNELVRFQLDDVIRAPANGQHQTKNGYKFTINDRSAFYDWYNGYLEVQFQLQKTADAAGYAAADRITTINGSHSLIKHLTIRSAGKIIYDTDNLHKVCFVKNLLEYSDDFSRSVAKNSFWYLDTNATTANTNAGFEARRLQTQAVQNNGGGGAKNINVIIPLNRFSFFEELEDKMLVPMQLQFEITLNDDGELIHMANGTDPGRVVVNRFLLWVPRLTPKDSLYDKFVSSFLKETQWKYLREMYQQSAPATSSGFFQISASIDNVKHIFVWLKRTAPPNDDPAEDNPFLMNTFKLNAADANSSLLNCRLEYGNGVFYPETEYDTESKVRIFQDVMAYAMRKNDYNTGTQLNLANFGSLYSLEKAIRGRNPISLRLKNSQLSGNDQAKTTLMLTANQIKKIQKAASQGKGVEIKVSKSQAQKVGGSLFSALFPLARSAAPMLAKTLGLSALAGLASEGASQVVKKISGSGQRAMTGGFLIPQDKIQKLIDNKHLLTNKQKEQILSALQSGGQIVVKPSKKQSGGLLGTMLASIGIPLAIEAVKSVFGKGAPRIGRPKGKGAPRIGRPKGGKGAPRLGGPFQRPPPIVGNWEQATSWGRGMGKKKSKKGERAKRGEGLLLGSKSPFNNIPILGAIL